MFVSLRSIVPITCIVWAASAGLASSADQQADVHAYVASVVGGSPEKCFDKVPVHQPNLTASRDRAPPLVRPVRVVVAIDGSGSMNSRLGDATRIELARKAAANFIDSLPPEVPAALVVFGQQGSNSGEGKRRSCEAIDVGAPMSADRNALRSALASVKAVGWTPLAAGLKRAGELLTSSEVSGEQIVYVVSDGEETCGGDPVAAARELRQGNTRAIVEIIGFGIPKAEARGLQEVAQAGGGNFTNAQSRNDVDRHLASVRENNRRFVNALRADNARSTNTLVAGNALSKAKTCISNIQFTERLQLDNRLAADLRKGRIRADFAAKARVALNERHQPMTVRLDEYTRQTQGAASSANRNIRQDADAVR